MDRDPRPAKAADLFRLARDLDADRVERLFVEWLACLQGDCGRRARVCHVELKRLGVHIAIYEPNPDLRSYPTPVKPRETPNGPSLQ